MSDGKIELRVTPLMRERVERLARDHKTTVSGAMRIAILQATKGDGIPDEHEVLLLLGEQARTGNVAALKELRSYHRERKTDSGDALGAFDELASRRSAQ